MEGYKVRPYQVYSYPSQRESNPHRRRLPKEHDIVIVEDVSKQPGGTHGKLMNHCGCAFPPNNSMAGKRCARPFREMSIRWDGNVAICCMDWRGYFKCGNISQKGGVEAVWNGKYFRAARRYLYYGMRTFTPCKGCDTRSYRVGLLPDKLGKIKLSKPTEKTKMVIEEALAGKSYTQPIKRPWEK
jgi:radical SAM protein with 4Fe4S-binding SPASM domain